MSQAYLAIDLGASSGRAMIGLLEGDPPRLTLEEVHRFEHHPCMTPTGPVWDLTGIWRNTLQGLRAAAAWCHEHGAQLVSIGVDTWGIDWTLVGSSGELLGLPHCYRDPQNEAACQRVLDQLGGFDRLYERTGIQRMAFNTLFQVAARHAAEPKLFEAAERLLFLPDLLHYWLSGEMVNERTIASTSSMLNVANGDWDRTLLEQLGLPTHILGTIVEPGTLVGPLRDELASATGAPQHLQVIAPASHDTASAVAAVPVSEKAAQQGWAYISSGTWSCLGAELSAPITTAEAAQVPFTNELGVGSTVRFLKNIAGLWLVQELRREMKEHNTDADYETLTNLAEGAEPLRTLIDPNAPQFASPGNMAEKIRAFARDTGQPEPDNPGRLVRCCLESLALCYRHTSEQLSAVVGHPIGKLFVVGGGTQNRLLNQLAADAMDCPVSSGPVEATAAGNVLVQAMGRGAIRSTTEIRDVVVRSFPLEEHERNRDDTLWSKVQERYLSLVADATAVTG